MNILVINGSPHVKGTSALLMDEFIRGAQEKGHEIHVFHAAREDVHPCIACDTCRKTDNGCVFKDGMEKLNPMLEDAELVVFVTPLYYFGMSAQIKAVFDRFYANNTLKHHFEDAFRYMRWTCIGSVYALGMYVREDIEQSDYPKEAYELGRSL